MVPDSWPAEISHGLLAASPQTTVAEYWPTNGWRTATPEEQGFDSVKFAEGLQTLQNKHIDSLLIIRNGYVILDAAYFPYDGTSIHDLGSVTKSVTTTLSLLLLNRANLSSTNRCCLIFLKEQLLISTAANKALQVET